MLTAIGLGVWVVGILIVSNVWKTPTYNMILAGDPDDMPADWEATRQRYFNINWIQLATTWATFALFLVALISLNRCWSLRLGELRYDEQGRPASPPRTPRDRTPRRLPQEARRLWPPAPTPRSRRRVAPRLVGRLRGAALVRAPTRVPARLVPG